MRSNDTPSVKRCGRCGDFKSVDQFYRLKTGYLHGYCHPCNTEARREWGRANRDSTLAVARRWRADNAERVAENTRRWRAQHPDAMMAAIRRWEAKNPERIRMVRRAIDAVRRATQKGTLIRPTACEACGVQGRQITAAHHDYTRPLDVRWLCRPCHGRWDRADPKTLHPTDASSTS